MLERFSIGNAKPVSIHLATYFRLSTALYMKIDARNEDMSNVLCANIDGCLLYAMVCTR